LDADWVGRTLTDNRSNIWIRCVSRRHRTPPGSIYFVVGARHFAPEAERHNWSAGQAQEVFVLPSPTACSRARWPRGLSTGVLLARTLSGIVGALLGWRWMFGLAAAMDVALLAS
jgi:hypothetical protein